MRGVSRSVAVVACLLAAVISLPAAAALGATERSLDAQTTRDFWTPAKLARAVALDSPRDQIKGVAADPLRGGAVPPYVSEPVADPSLQPYPAVGKVFFKLDGGIYVCSAAIVDSPSDSLVWTAAHCIRDPGRRGEFASKWLFVPGYDQGDRPYGTWPAKTVVITRGWVRNNQHYDFGAAVIRRQGGTAVADAVGGALPLGVNSSYDQEWEAVGYPEATIWGQQLWHCESGLYRRDSFRGSGPDPIGIGCDMTGGSSGGPWINEAGELGAVTAYGYRNQTDALYGTYLGGSAANLFADYRNKH